MSRHDDAPRPGVCGCSGGQREAQHVAALEFQIANLEHALHRERENSREWRRKARRVIATRDLVAALCDFIDLLEGES